MLLIYCITSIHINVLVKFNVHIHVIKQNYDIDTRGLLHVLDYLTLNKLIRLFFMILIVQSVINLENIGEKMLRKTEVQLRVDNLETRAILGSSP